MKRELWKRKGGKLDLGCGGVFKGWFLSLGAWETAQEGEGQGNATPRDELYGSAQRKLTAASCPSLPCATGVGESARHRFGARLVRVDGSVRQRRSANTQLRRTAAT